MGKSDDKINLAAGLGNMAFDQIRTGALSAAGHNLRRRNDFCREIEDKFSEAISYQELGRILSYRGAWQEAEQELDSAIAIQQKIKHVQTENISHAYRALRFLLMAREKAIADTQKSNNKYRISAIECAQCALELADEETKQRYAHPRDYVRGYWLLGAAYRASVVSIRPVDYSTTELESLTLAEENLSKALNLCRQINSVDEEANILLDFARLRYDQKIYEESKSLADEALLITERCGYVLQGADVNLFLAQYALEQEKD